MENYASRREFARFGRLHTFDILIHLLESVAFCRLIDTAGSGEICGPVASPPHHRRWQVAWDFLRTEGFIVTLGNVSTPGLLVLSDEGEELLEELQETRLDPGTDLYPNDWKGRTDARPFHFRDAVGTDFQTCVYRAIGVMPTEVYGEA